MIARFVTDFADQALLLPLAAALALLFLVLGWRRGAWAWALAVGATLGTMLLLKLLSIACAGCWFGPELTSPSGHTAAGAAIYGGLAGMLLPHRRPLVVAMLCGLVVAGIFGASRLVLQVHSMAEVLVGAGVGTAGAVGFVLGAGPRAARVRAWYPLGLAVAVAAALHGIQLPAEASIQHAGVQWVPVCAQCRSVAVPAEGVSRANGAWRPPSE